VEDPSYTRHIAYVACDPKITRKSTQERRAVVVYDGNIFAGPFPSLTVLFMSPSGKHLAYSLDLASSKFYLDKKVLAKTSTVIDAAWSPDESKLAFIGAGEHGKFFVAVDGKRSPLFERIGRLGWSADGTRVEFTGVSNGKVITVRQSL
jgi:protease II